MPQRKLKKFSGSEDLYKLYLPSSPFQKSRTLEARDLITGNAIHLQAIAQSERLLKEASSIKQQEQREIRYHENLEALNTFWN